MSDQFEGELLKRIFCPFVYEIYYGISIAITQPLVTSQSLMLTESDCEWANK